ncbi:hypothetical protein [Paracoccus mutanolyticus]|uniref:hypothetical protein n=1 Tax=Paracoccus mutanolyticus TaxID=1499308 RepID=UPI00167876C6|nr:hypothetical protein [Paracoccus mutanolyticus]
MRSTRQHRCRAGTYQRSSPRCAGRYAARLDYRLTVSKSDGAAQVTAVAEGYDNIMHGQGRCLSPAEG